MGVVVATRDYPQWLEMLKAPNMESRLLGASRQLLLHCCTTTTRTTLQSQFSCYAFRLQYHYVHCSGTTTRTAAAPPRALQQQQHAHCSSTMQHHPLVQHLVEAASVAGCHILGEQLKDPIIAAMIFHGRGLSSLKAIRKHILKNPCPDCMYGSKDDVLFKLDNHLIPRAKRGIELGKQWGSPSAADAEELPYNGTFTVVAQTVEIHSEHSESSPVIATETNGSTLRVSAAVISSRMSLFLIRWLV